MGVHGLWRLIEPSGKPVPLETLENKVLAVDISIWLHQAIKGFQDAKGAPLPNAHLLGIFHRVCKLLYYRIRPVFVFDGGIPVLKRQTIAKRNQLKLKNTNDANRLQKQLLNSLLKHSAINAVLSDKAKAALESDIKKASVSNTNQQDDLFELPPSQTELVPEESGEESDDDHLHIARHMDLHTIDEKGARFKSLPANIRHEILSELKDTRKQSSWGRIHELPTQSDDFSSYQMERLLKRHSVQMSLEEAEKEMGGFTLSMGELEKLLTNHGVIASSSIVSRHIASDENKRYVYIKNLKETIEQALSSNENVGEIIEGDLDKEKENKSKADREYESDLGKAIELSLENRVESNEDLKSTDKNSSDMIDSLTEVSQSNQGDVVLNDTPNTSTSSEYDQDLEEAIQLSLTPIIINEGDGSKSKAEKEYEKDLEEAIKLSLQDDGTISKNSVSICENMMLDDDDDDGNHLSDSSGVNTAESELTNNVLASARSYMTEYSGLTPAEILKILGTNTGVSNVDMSRKASNDIKDRKSKPQVSNKINFSKLLIKKPSNSNRTIVDLTKKAVVELVSDSDSSDDFLEVETSTEPNKKDDNPQIEDGESLQITIEKVSSLDDDLFSDIFKEAPKEKSNIEATGDLHDKQLEIGQIGNEITKEIVQDPIDRSISTNKTESSELLQEILESSTINNKLTTSELKGMRDELAQERRELIREKSTKERLAGNITDQMYQEAQELLELFGVPYIIAPMEAEAQCGFLNEINLTDGTITDDSDVWLFGGRTVYKNFFNQSKHVMEFDAENIQQSFKLSRQEMILFALLVGSDYTTGIQGIGPVTALEILADFSPPKNESNLNHLKLLQGLREFRRWFNTNNKAVKPARTALRNKLKNVEISDQFPSLQVLRAYMEPTVETSQEQFSWQKPDMPSLIEFARQKFGWNLKKSEEILKPVLKRLEETVAQSRITDYFKTKHKIQRNLAEDKMSKRVKKAVTKIANNDDGESPQEESVNSIKTKGLKKTSSKNKKEEQSPVTTDQDLQLLQQTKRYSRNKIKEMKIDLNERLLKMEAESSSKAKDIGAVSRLLRKETIPQKERSKADLLRNKMRAVEVFRKSKQGPGYVKRRIAASRQPKEDAELSESSDS